MLRYSRYLVAFCGAVIGLASFLVGLEVSVTTAAPSAEHSLAEMNRTVSSLRPGGAVSDSISVTKPYL